MRVRKLVESKCDQLALKLSRQAIRAIRYCTDAHPLRQTVSVRQHQSLLEVYLSLLFKYKKIAEIKDELQQMDYESSTEFLINSFSSINENESIIVNRNAVAITSQRNEIDQNKIASIAITSTATPGSQLGKRLNSNRLHKHHVRVSQYALQLFIVRTLTEESNDTRNSTLEQFLGFWIEQHKHESNFQDLFAKLVHNAQNKFQKYICCESLYKTVNKINSRLLQIGKYFILHNIFCFFFNCSVPKSVTLY